jgi:hypothetical protein
MSNGIKYFVTFALGAAAGSVAAWVLLKSKYEQLAKEEVDEVREYYRNKEAEIEAEVDADVHASDWEPCDEYIVAEDPEMIKYEALAESYTDQEGGSDTLTFSPTDEVPYVISPEEFAADDEYQSESLTLYACGTLTDDFDNPIEDIDAMVGDALDHFGEYDGDDDSVFVRNDRYKCNYEILKDVRTYEQAKNRTLNLVEDDE